MNNKGKGTREYIEEFILYKHSLGYVYETPAYYLRKYAAFEEINYPGSLMARETVDRYLDTLGDTPGNLYEAVCAMRGFSRHLLKQGIDAYMIPPKRVRRLTPDPPYFFTREEIGRFFSAVDSVESLSGYKGRELILPALFRLLYCCGIRCREARMLRLENVSLADGFIDILQSKGPKSRRLYISGELKKLSFTV